MKGQAVPSNVCLCVRVRCSEVYGPCEFEDRRRSWTSLDRSACSGTQTAPSSTRSGSAHKSGKSEDEDDEMK